MWEGHPVLTSQSSFLPVRKPGKAFPLTGDDGCKGTSISGHSVGTKHHHPQAVPQAIHNDTLYWLLVPEEQGIPGKGEGFWGCNHIWGFSPSSPNILDK